MKGVNDMADMTFKANLLPNSQSFGYSLGSNENRWKIYGDQYQEFPYIESASEYTIPSYIIKLISDGYKSGYFGCMNAEGKGCPTSTGDLWYLIKWKYTKIGSRVFLKASPYGTNKVYKGQCWGNNETSMPVWEEMATEASIGSHYVTLDTAQTISGAKTFSNIFTVTNDSKLISHGNEFNFVPTLSSNMEVHFNHRQTGGNGSAQITKYHFKNGLGAYASIQTGRMYPINMASSWISGQKTDLAAINITAATDTGSYWPWIRQINTSSGKAFSFGIINNQFSWVGSTTSRTENGYDHGMHYNVDTGILSVEQVSGNCTTCSYPLGFVGRTTSSAWGNTMGTHVTGWTYTGSCDIAFLANNPSTGKLSIKVDGRFYGAEGNYPAGLMKSANSYWGMTDPDGADNVWIRTTSNGIIPYQSGGFGSGHQSIGTSSWYFQHAYIDTTHGNLDGNATTASALKPIASIGSSSTNHDAALKNYFSSYNSSIPRNKLISFYDNSNSNGGVAFGYFLDGYNSNPYGGFFVSHYNTPYYVGIQNGTYSNQTILTSSNYTSYTVTKTGGGASGTWGINISGNAATATTANSATTATKASQDDGGYNINGWQAKEHIDIIDCSSLNVNTWYPAVIELPIDGMHLVGVVNELNGGVKPAWASHDSGYTCCVELLVTRSGWGTTNRYTILLQNDQRFITDMNVPPVGYNQFTNSSRACFYLRGGGKYRVRDTWKGTWTLYTSSTTLSSQTIAPVTSYPGMSGIDIQLLDRDKYSRFVRAYGAVWNDYAEMRNVDESIEPGKCVREVGNGKMVLSTERLERGCKVISDTYGFNIGETEECKTPIAVSGRVLAYLYEGREYAKSHIGWPVCSGPDGTVSVMSEEEEIRYPSRIIGTISEIPEYETWGTGNVQVNDRVWIYVR